jgi:hypothetical protein
VACLTDVFDKLAAHAKTVSPVQDLTIYSNRIPQIL